MRDQNMTQQQIAQAMDYSLRTVQRALSRYDEHGMESLHDAPRPGRPQIEPHLSDIVETQAGQPPTVYGYLQTVWTVALLALHLLERFRVEVSTTTVRRAWHAIRFSWHRPKLTPARKLDPRRAARQDRLAEVLADSAADTTIIAADECDVHLLAVLRAMRHAPFGGRQRIGEQLRLPTPGQEHPSESGPLRAMPLN